MSTHTTQVVSYYQLPLLLSAASTGAVTGTTTSAATVTAARADSAAVTGTTASTATVTGSRADSATVTGATTSTATVTAVAVGGPGSVAGTTTSHATITATVTNPVVTVTGGSWYELISITDEARQYALQARELSLMACPNDGEPYRTGPDGSLFCPYDGYKPKP